MHTNHQPEDLTELERRLSAWQPDGAGLDADAVLFAAGRASVRPSKTRFLWPALTTGLAGLALVLGLCLKTEHAERLALAQQMQQPAPAPPSPPAAFSPAEQSPAEDVPPSSVLAAHRALEHGLDAWSHQGAAHVETPASSLDNSPILYVGRRDVLLDP